MLKLPADLQLAIISESRTAHSAGLTCKQLHRLLNTPESVLRLYLASKGQSKADLQLYWRSSSSKRLSTHQLQLISSTADPDTTSNTSSISNRLQLVYGLLTWGRLLPWARTEDGALRTLQLMCECAVAVKAVSEQQQQHALKAWQSQAGSSSAAANVAAGVGMLQQLLPYAEHCLLPYCAAGGHVHLVKALLPQTYSPVLMRKPMVHYVKTSAFFAAAAGGQAAVLSELLASGALQWACQLPGASLTRTALDLAAQGGHLEVLNILKKWVGRPNSTFLAAAADSGNGAVMEWALGFWFAQFNAVTGFSTDHLQQLHDALRVSCEAGHLAAIRQLLRYLHAVRCYGSCVLALSYTCATSNTEALACVLQSPYFPQQLERGRPKSLERLAMVTASCLRIAIRVQNQHSLELLLTALETPASALGAVRSLLGPQMPSIFDQAATAGNALALQLLLTRLPEQYAALGMSALEGALSEGHTQLAHTIRTLLIMRGPSEGCSPGALSGQHNPRVASAERHGQLKAASSRGDVVALQQLLAVQAGPDGASAALGPSDNEQLLMLRLAAAAGQEDAVRFLLHEFGGAAGGQRAELCICAVVRGAVHAGQVSLLQSLERDPFALLQQHLTQADAVAEYSRAALLCGQPAVAAWLVTVAARQQLLPVFRSTLVSWLTASRGDLWNTGVGRSARDAAAVLLSALAMAQPTDTTAAAAAAAGGSDGSGGAAGGTSTVMPDITPSVAAAAAPGLVPSAAAAEAHDATDNAAAAAPVAAVQQHHEPLLNPQVLSLLLQAAAGDPAMLYSVVDLVQLSWGAHDRAQQQQTQRQQSKAVLAGQRQRQEDRHSNSSSGSTSEADILQQPRQLGGLQLCAADPLSDVLPELVPHLTPASSSSSSSGGAPRPARVKQPSYNSVPSSSNSSCSALFGDDRSHISHRACETCCSPKDSAWNSESQAGLGPESQAGARPHCQAGLSPESQAGTRPHCQAGLSPESQAGTRPHCQAGPTVLGSSKSDVLLGADRVTSRISNDVAWSDQQQQAVAVNRNRPAQKSQRRSFQGHDLDGMVTVEGSPSSSSGGKGKLQYISSTCNNSVDVQAVGSPVCHPLHTPHKLQQAAAALPLAGQQQQCQQPSQDGGSRSLKQLTGGVQRLSVTCPKGEGGVQQQQQEHQRQRQQGLASDLADAQIVRQQYVLLAATCVTAYSSVSAAANEQARANTPLHAVLAAAMTTAADKTAVAGCADSGGCWS